ncbi:hypothetical protein D4Q85_00830 [bacterium]|nr:MAG: hypothetical protein D4Q85_00830 [bacterium]
MDLQRPISVFFGRGGYAPSQITVDHGWASVAATAALSGGFSASLFLLLRLPLNTSGGFMLHLKGFVGSLASSIIPATTPWKLLWFEHVMALDMPGRAVLCGKLAVAGLIGAWLAVHAWRRVARPIDGYLHIRGRRLLEGTAALAAARAVSRLEAGKDADSQDLWVHPKVRFSAERMSRHGILVGKVGGGKTTILVRMIHQIIEGGHKSLIFDIKGDSTAKFYRGRNGPVAILAPWDRRSLIWDIARDCRTRAEAIRFANYLIKDSKDPMWSAAARQLCVGFLVHLQMTRGERWGWKDIADMLTTPETELLAIMRDANPEAIRAVEQTGTTTTGILINLSAFLSVIFDLAEAWPEPVPGRMFSIQDWIFNDRTRHKAVILGGNKEFGPLMTSFASALIAQAAACVCSPRLAESRSRRLYFILDEFPQLGKIDIEPLVAVGRSKGARVWLGLQDFGQMKKIYGQDEAQAIAAMVGTIVCAGAAPGETAKFIADMAGDREVERSNMSTSVQGGSSQDSTSHSWQRESIPVISESQAAGLGPVPGTREIRALLLNYGEDALILRWPFDTRPNIAKPVVLAEWTRPTAERQALAQQQAELEAIATLEGEDKIEAERRLALSRELAALAKAPPVKEAYSAERAADWLAEASQNQQAPDLGQGAAPESIAAPNFVTDAPSEGEGYDPASSYVLEQLAESAAAGSDYPELGDLAAGLLKLAEAADALCQPPGPTRRQAPIPRRVN